MKYKLIVEGSNIPMIHEVEESFHKKGVLIVPDFVAYSLLSIAILFALNIFLL